ncbi:transcription initiation factor IIF, beta subunit-domain-containing protein [Whalleya microplaca]|nr:transcription initiation factor IIF, beta subunit-domain-containing protein [Whalleya microplaca]
MATPRVKAEASIKPEPGIKAEPDDGVGASPSVMSEDDIYEDAGDLDFYDPSDISADAVYLTHVPKYLYDAWANLDDDAEIRIGTVRQWTEGEGDKAKTHIAMLLDHRLAQHQPIPKEYNLDVKDMKLPNTFLFTEQDLPGYKNKAQGPNSDIPAHLRPRPERPPQKPQPEAGRKQRYQPYYRKAIPKKTVLAGRFRHELNCHPVWTEEAKHLLSIRNTEITKPKSTTTLAGTSKPSGVITVGTHVPNDRFIRPGGDPKKAGKKQKEEKAARLPKSELLDRIFNCFERYRYWSMKSFKQELRQPEAWLREVLDEIAFMHRTGPFTNYWELRQDGKDAGNVPQNQSVAPNAAPEVDESESDADDVEMEDVIPS